MEMSMVIINSYFKLIYNYDFVICFNIIPLLCR